MSGHDDQERVEGEEEGGNDSSSSSSSSSKNSTGTHRSSGEAKGPPLHHRTTEGSPNGASEGEGKRRAQDFPPDSRPSESTARSRSTHSSTGDGVARGGGAAVEGAGGEGAGGTDRGGGGTAREGGGRWEEMLEGWPKDEVWCDVSDDGKGDKRSQYAEVNMPRIESEAKKLLSTQIRGLHEERRVLGAALVRLNQLKNTLIREALWMPDPPPDATASTGAPTSAPEGGGGKGEGGGEGAGGSPQRKKRKE